ncbi:MAG: GNAT family N-acetyltransferase [Terriglobia bacterium]
MTEPSLEIRTYSSLASLESLRGPWEDLLSGFPSATIFSTWEWLAPWWRAFGNGQQLRVLGFFDSGQRLVALAPLSATTQRIPGAFKLKLLQLMGDGSSDSDNLDLPVLPGYEPAFAGTLLDLLQTDSIPWDVCYLNTLPSGSPAGNALLADLKRRGWPAFTHHIPCSAIELPGSWEGYLKQLSSKERGKVGIRTRKLEKLYQVQYLKCAHQGELPGFLEALFRLHQERWEPLGERGSFGDAARRQFYYEMSCLLLARDGLEFWLLHLDGKPVAAQFGFRHGDTVFSLQEGFDPAHSADSVGYVLRAHVLKQLIDRGTRRYDFLGGAGHNKGRWGAQAGNYVNLRFSRPRRPGSLYLHLVQSRGQAKGWLRDHLPREAWLMLHRLNCKLRGIPDQKPGGREAKSHKQS